MKLRNENEYEDLLSLWSDLESGLCIILRSPDSVQEFEQRVCQYDRWMQALLQQDTDVGLYLLFQLATNSFVGYSTSHALVCAVLCHLIATDLKLPASERDSLVHAALTMNIAMTSLQDQLAEQIAKPDAAQQVAIRGHAAKGALMMSNKGIVDELWLDAIGLHHDENLENTGFRDLPPVKRLARILRTVDRYAAMISPRKSREGRSATESVRSLTSSSEGQAKDEVGLALIRSVGLYPPGTYVLLDSHEIALVKRRGSNPDLPDVAIVSDSTGASIPSPRLHQTCAGSPAIKRGLAASVVKISPNHHHILRLAASHPK